MTLLEHLATLPRGTHATVHQAIVATGLQPRVMKSLPDWAEGEGYLHIDTEGKAKQMTILPEGSKLLKAARLTKNK